VVSWLMNTIKGEGFWVSEYDMTWRPDVIVPKGGISISVIYVIRYSSHLTT